MEDKLEGFGNSSLHVAQTIGSEFGGVISNKGTKKKPGKYDVKNRPMLISPFKYNFFRARRRMKSHKEVNVLREDIQRRDKEGARCLTG